MTKAGLSFGLWLSVALLPGALGRFAAVVAEPATPRIALAAGSGEVESNGRLTCGSVSKTLDGSRFGSMAFRGPSALPRLEASPPSRVSWWRSSRTASGAKLPITSFRLSASSGRKARQCRNTTRRWRPGDVHNPAYANEIANQRTQFHYSALAPTL